MRDKFNRLAEQLAISSITLGELCHGVEKSARRLHNLQALDQFAARIEVLSFSPRAAAHYGQLRVELERLGKPAGRHDMLIGAHARAEGLLISH